MYLIINLIINNIANSANKYQFNFKTTMIIEKFLLEIEEVKLKLIIDNSL